MALPRGLVEGQGLTWIGAEEQDGPAAPGDRGRFVDYDGGPESYVVEFGAGLFCCEASDVRPDARPPVAVTRRHKAP